MRSTLNEQTEKPAWIRTNQGVGVCLVAVFGILIIYLMTQDWVYTELRDGFHLGTFTVVAAVAMLLCAVALVLDRHRHDTDEEMLSVRTRDFLTAIVAALTCFIYFKLAWNVDFLIITPIFLFGGMYILGVRPLRTALFAGVVTTAVIFGLFFLLGIRLPSFLTPA